MPTIQHTPTNVLNVNTYKQLKKQYNGRTSILRLQQDHIPSYAAIEQFFINHNIKTKSSFKIVNNKKITLRDTDLEYNETAIAVPEDIHMFGRTFGGKNTSNQIQQDSQNLLLATIKDITTTSYGFYKNPQYNITLNDYIQSAMYIYARNKMLCLYDVK